MRHVRTLLAALALGAACPAAQATSAPPLTLMQQAKKAEVIVRATPGTPTRLKEGEVTWLVYPLTISETVAGDAASLPQLEGKPALYLLAGVEDLPELRPGQEAFLLLYSGRMDSPIVGFSQGVYPIENGRVTRLGETPEADLAPTTPGGAAPSSAAPPAGTATPDQPAAATAPAPTDPNAIERDPARFRDALRAARGAQ